MLRCTLEALFDEERFQIVNGGQNVCFPNAAERVRDQPIAVDSGQEFTGGLVTLSDMRLLRPIAQRRLVGSELSAQLGQGEEAVQKKFRGKHAVFTSMLHAMPNAELVCEAYLRPAA